MAFSLNLNGPTDILFTEQSFHFSPLPLNFWICLHRRMSLPNQRLYLKRRTVALYMSLSLETNLSLFANGVTCAVVVFSVLGAHHCFIRSPDYWLCKGIPFSASRNACQSQMGADNLTVFCRGAPPFSVDLLLKRHAENFTVGFWFFSDTAPQQVTTFLFGVRAIFLFWFVFFFP